MSIYFGEKFKSLRKKSDFTQDQIAEIFHVAPQSVSRWETGVNYPDVELLPHLAVFFKVTVDELLGTEAMLGAEKAEERRREIQNLLNSGRGGEAVDAARRAVKEHPVNYNLQGLLVQALCAAEDSEERRSDVIGIGERIIGYCADQNTCLWAKFLLFRQ